MSKSRWMELHHKSEWLKRHKLADFIVWDTLRWEPSWAEYRTINGIPRDYPVGYLYPDNEGFNLEIRVK